MIERLFETWSRLVLDHPRRVALATLLLLLVLGLSISRLRFETDLQVMIPTESGAVLEEVDRVFGIREQSFLVVESPREGEASALIAFAAALAEALEGNEHIAQVSYGFQEIQEALLTRLLPYAPRYAPPGEEASLDRLFSAEDLDRRIARQRARLSLPGLGVQEDILQRDPLDLGTFLWGRLVGLKGASRFDPSSPHFISADGRAILILIRGRLPADDMAAVRVTTGAIDRAVARALELSGSKGFLVHAGGAHFLGRESEAAVRADLIRAMTLSVVLVLGLIAWSLRRPLAGVLALPSLFLGVLGGLGIFSLYRQKIASISMASAAIQVGLAVDFAIHLMQAAFTERARGAGARESVERALIETGPSLFYAALTTIVAFLAFPTSSFDFLSEMGLLTGFGVLASLLATVSVLPPLLAFWLGRRRDPATSPRKLGVLLVVEAVLRAPRLSLTLVLLVTACAVVSLILSPPALEDDLRNIHSGGSRALRAEDRLEEVFGGTREPLLLLLSDRNAAGLESQLRRLQGPLDALVASGALTAHASAAVLLPPPGSEERAVRRLASLEPALLRKDIREALDRAGFDSSTLAGQIEAVAAAAADREPLTVDRLRGMGLGTFLDAFCRPDPAQPGRMLGLVTLFPSQGLWAPGKRKESLERIRHALREAEVQASLTGLLLMSAESADLVISEMASLGGLTALAVALLVAVQFRRPGTTVLALLPVTLGCLWTAALLNLLGYRLHFMNASVLPMVIGIGVDSGTHLLHRYRLLQRQGILKGAARLRETFSVTGAGVALSSLTIMMSFGSLAFSSSRGLASVGILSFIGVGASLFISLTFLPAVLLLAGRRRGVTPPDV